MKYIDLSENARDKKFVTEKFYKNGKSVEGALWGMTLKSAGSMRFRWAENNANRVDVLERIAGTFENKCFVPVELDHTKIVYPIQFKEDTDQKIGDGIVTFNKDLIPVVTVADCMPVFLFEPESGFFGVVHSGWKGTGIIGEAVKMGVKEYGVHPENILVSLGPHIHDCCYVVNKERAQWFTENFTADCVTPVKPGESLCRGAASSWDNGTGQLFRLSLLKANLSVLERSGIRDENITVSTNCTCCNEIFGSNRRETSLGTNFTVQAAFTIKL